MYGHTFYSKGMDQPGKVANPARGQLNKENDISLSAFAPENLVSSIQHIVVKRSELLKTEREDKLMNKSTNQQIARCKQ